MQFDYIYIEREYASGGKEIGGAVSSLLGIPVYGRDILERAAEIRKTTVKDLEYMEENASSSFLYTAYMSSRLASCRGGNTTGIADEDSLHDVEADVIRTLAEKGPAIFIGRCAGVALKSAGYSCLRVFIHASSEFRLRRATTHYGIAPEKATSTLKHFDKRRANYYRANTRRDWNDLCEYHLVLDSSVLGIDLCAEIVAACAKGELPCQDL